MCLVSYAMRCQLILSRQLLLLSSVMMLIDARSPLEILSSSVRAFQLTTQIDRSYDQDYSAGYLSVTTESPPQAESRSKEPPAFVLLAPAWGFVPNMHRRQDDDMETSSSQTKSQQIVVAWPADLELPSRKIPLRLIAAMAVPVSTYNSDPLLTQGELSEVVYYSSMDLRKLNISAGNDKLIIKNNKVYKTEAPLQELDDEPLVTEIDHVTPVFTETPVTETTREQTFVPTTYNPRLVFPTPLPPSVTIDENLIEKNSKELEVEDDRQRRSWFNEPRDPDIVKHPGGPGRGHQWMDGESVAYIAVGTCCGLSVLTLAIVLLVLRVRGNYAAKRRRHFNNVITLSNGHEKDKNSSIESDDESTSIQLPQRLLNLMNNRSQEVSTHKLGSWFNGRPTLSIRHGADMAFPAPITSFHEERCEEQHVEQQQNNLSADDILEVSSSDFTPEEENADFDFDESDSNNNDVPQSLEAVVEASESSQDESLSGSKHDTFIFWSTNSDRLV